MWIIQASSFRTGQEYVKDCLLVGRAACAHIIKPVPYAPELHVFVRWGTLGVFRINRAEITGLRLKSVGVASVHFCDVALCTFLRWVVCRANPMSRSTANVTSRTDNRLAGTYPTEIIRNPLVIRER